MKTTHQLYDVKRLVVQRRMIYEMVEASMALSGKKGCHELEKSCSCILCVNKRKQILNGPSKEWKFVL